jgi:RecB family exonuclease
VLHAIAERFIKAGVSGDPEMDRAALMAVARSVLAEHVPWPVTRTLWQARLDRIAGEFLSGEYARQAEGSPIAFEVSGRMKLDAPEFTLTGTADRIDRLPGGLAIYDYKSGTVPSKEVVKHFDRQLLLEAMMAEADAFGKVSSGIVTKVAHIGLGANPEVRPYDLTSTEDDGYNTETILAEFRRLLAAYLEPGQGFASRRAMEKVGYEGDYDHLARYGEWDETVKPIPEVLP